MQIDENCKLHLRRLLTKSCYFAEARILCSDALEKDKNDFDAKEDMFRLGILLREAG